MTANTHPYTGIPYGYISANALHPELVDELLDDGENQSAKSAYQEWFDAKMNEIHGTEGFEAEQNAWDEVNGMSQEFWDQYEDYEPIIDGMKDGVHYLTSWLGGALNFYIFESPHVTDKARECSPCVPNAGNLDDMTGSYTCYDVPADWRRDENE